MPKFLATWLSRYADRQLAGRVSQLESENKFLRTQQVTLFGAIKSWWLKKLTAHADRQLRADNAQLKANLQVAQDHAHRLASELTELHSQLRQATVDVVRAGRGQPVTTRNLGPGAYSNRCECATCLGGSR